MTNYLDPVTNTGAVEAAEAGGDIFQLGLDWLYSMLMFIIYFVQENFGVIMLVAVLSMIFGFGVKRILSKGKAKTNVV